ncbi:MAG: hypothetical protein JST73_10745, partial [Actinobacteria bacterium]|nr:hypothetical protein [Actinomycetota bacterium]
LDALPERSPTVGTGSLERGGPNIEAAYEGDLENVEYAVEVSYEGTYELDEATLTDGSALDEHFAAMGGWIAATLVRLADVQFEFLPPEDQPAV